MLAVLYDHCLQEGREDIGLQVLGAWFQCTDEPNPQHWTGYWDWMNAATWAARGRRLLEQPRRIMLLDSQHPIEEGNIGIGRVLSNRQRGDGTYAVEIQVTDEAFWQRIQRNEFSGWSIGSRAATSMMAGTQLRLERLRHEAWVLFGDERAEELAASAREIGETTLESFPQAFQRLIDAETRKPTP
jgi:hypothetical protein